MNAIPNMTRRPGDPKIVSSGPSSLGAADRLARALGWFSIGLGTMELVMARRMTRMLGMYGSENLVRLFGVREIAAGVITLSPDKTTGLTSRVAGDVLDMAVLFRALRSYNPERTNARAALAMVAAVTLLDLYATYASASSHSRARGGALKQYRDRSGFPKGVEAARGLARRGSTRAEDVRSVEPTAASVH